MKTKLFKNLGLAFLGFAMITVVFVGNSYFNENNEVYADTTGEFSCDITGWSSNGGTIKLGNINWGYGSATYLAKNSGGVQIGSKSNPQTDGWTISTAISNLGNSPTVKSVSISAKTAGSGTYSINIGSSTSTTGSLSSTYSTYSKTGISETTGNISITITGSSKAQYLASITVVYSTSDKTLSSLAVSGSPTTKNYESGDKLNCAGLTVTGTYSDESTATITEGISWSTNPQILNTGDTTCSVQATVGTITSPAYTVSGLTVTASTKGSFSINRSDFISNLDQQKTYKEDLLFENTQFITIEGCFNCANATATELNDSIGIRGYKASAPVGVYSGIFISSNIFNLKIKSISFKASNASTSKKHINFFTSNNPYSSIKENLFNDDGSLNTSTDSGYEDCIEVGANTNKTSLSYTFTTSNNYIAFTTGTAGAIKDESITFDDILVTYSLNDNFNLIENVTNADSCTISETTVSEYVGTYNSYTTAQKNKFDPINIKDYAKGDRTHSGGKNTDYTLIYKLKYIVSRYNENKTGSERISLTLSDNSTFYSEANIFSFNKLFNQKNDSTWIIVAVSLTGLTAIGGYFFYKKRKENI